LSPGIRDTVVVMRSSDLDQLVRDVGRRVGEERGRRGWTQEQFAEALGYSLKFTQRIEGGRENLTIKSAAMLADALGVPLVALFKKPRTKQPGPGRPKKRTHGIKTAAG
jgi:transcriptional regulator with XRE-family HTH domain